MRATYPERGEKFGRWTVLKPAPHLYTSGGNQRTMVLCRCTCGTVRQVGVLPLRYGKSLSCGCYTREQVSKSKGTHRRTQDPIYRTWISMRRRCEIPSEPAFPDYGARGIKVCERWWTFENFLADMGERPLGMTLDRIDNNGNYEPSNCRWATYKQQNHNRRDNVWIVLPNGSSVVFKEACRLTGVDRTSAGKRAKATGISHQEAFDYYLSRLK